MLNVHFRYLLSAYLLCGIEILNMLRCIWNGTYNKQTSTQCWPTIKALMLVSQADCLLRKVDKKRGQNQNLIYSQWTKHYRYIYHTTDFDPTYCSKTKYCMRQSVAQVRAGCNKQNIVFNNGLLELQLAVMLHFCNITAGCYLNRWLLHTIFCLLSVCWIKTNGCIYLLCFVR